MFLALVFLTKELFNPRGVLKNVLYGEGPPRGPTPYLVILFLF